VVHDITERKIAEDALRDSEEKYRTLIQHSNDPIFSFNPDETYTYVNHAFARVFGLKPEDLIGKSPHAIFSFEEAEKRLTMVRKVFRTGLKDEIEVKVVAPSGEVKYYLTMLDPVLNDQGKVLFVTCISKVFSESKQRGI
jgi:PAS domain S-box-containing protein